MMTLIDERLTAGVKTVMTGSLEQIRDYLGEGFEDCEDAYDLNEVLNVMNDGMAGYKVIED